MEKLDYPMSHAAGTGVPEGLKLALKNLAAMLALVTSFLSTFSVRIPKAPDALTHSDLLFV